MATQEELKRKAMDSVSHRETASLIRRLTGGREAARPTPTPSVSPPSGGIGLSHAKRQAMNAITHVETVAQVGWMKVAAGTVAYAGRIREADRDSMQHQARSGPHQRPARVERLGRDHD